jgi:hypothetical protein
MSFYVHCFSFLCIFSVKSTKTMSNERRIQFSIHTPLYFSLLSIFIALLVMTILYIILGVFFCRRSLTTSFILKSLSKSYNFCLSWSLNCGQLQVYQEGDYANFPDPPILYFTVTEIPLLGGNPYGFSSSVYTCSQT